MTDLSPRPLNEQDRLRYLRALHIDQTTSISQIDALCAMAADIAGAQVALVSLVEEHVCVFPFSSGSDNLDIDAVETSQRALALYANTIMSSRQLVVEDASVDPRFQQSLPLAEPNGICAYVGTPLEPEPEIRIGTLCVLDFAPRRYTPEVLGKLRSIADAITALIVAYRDRLDLTRALKESEAERRASVTAARMDGLTGLLNAPAFREECAKAVLDATGHVALILVNIDRFKMVNDCDGHAFGDRCLIAFARAIRIAAGSGALVGRLGGDEFAMLVPTMPSGQQKRTQCLKAEFDACRREIDAQMFALKRPDLGAASFGGAYLCDGMSSIELFQQADIALSVSKTNGRNRATVFDSSLGDHVSARSLLSQVDGAISRGEIVPFYQPQWHLETGAIIGFEVLCRWHHPTRGLLTPAEFDIIFRDHHAAPRVTRSLIAQICEDHRALRETGFDIGGLALNTTFYDLNDPTFLDYLGYHLDQADIAWSRISIEVTEGVVLGLTDGRVYETLAQLRKNGAEIALDDFGTGHGALLHLAKWPIDTIKIDKSFVDDICASDRHREIVSAIVHLGRALGLCVVAEGIETHLQAGLLAQMDCQKGQGFLCARPMPLANLRTFLALNEARLHFSDRTATFKIGTV